MILQCSMTMNIIEQMVKIYNQIKSNYYVNIK